MKCKPCGEPVDASSAFGRLLDSKGRETLVCSQACLAAEAPERVSPGYGAVNERQPAMMLVPAPPGYTGPTADASAVRASLRSAR